MSKKQDFLAYSIMTFKYILRMLKCLEVTTTHDIFASFKIQTLQITPPPFYVHCSLVYLLYFKTMVHNPNQDEQLLCSVAYLGEAHCDTHTSHHPFLF